MDRDIFLNKKAAIERCLKRAREEYAENPANLENITKQDSIVLNVQRACETAIDLAMHVVSSQKLGVPQASREAFRILAEAGFISKETGLRLEKMVGFRNIAVRDYQKLNLDILADVLKKRLSDFQSFLSELEKKVPEK